MIERDNLLEKAKAIGEKIRSRLESWAREYDLIGEVRGLGAMMAAELVRDRKTKEPATEETKVIVAACREEGLLTLSCGNYGNVIRILAPLVISDENLNKALSILEGAIRKADKSI